MAGASGHQLVAVTACVSGVAHTYMAAERLEKLCRQEKWSVQIETQGALGIEGWLSQDEVSGADAVLLITDIDLTGNERFADCRYVKCGIHLFLRDPQKVMSAVRKLFSAPQHTQITLS
jgi:PTS system IIB component